MEYAQAIFTNAAIYIIAALGLAIFTGYTGLFSLGHAAFMAVGAYTAAILTYFFNWPFLAALLAGVVAAMLASVLIGYPTLRARLRSDYFAIATLGFGEAVRVLLENLALTQGARGMPGLHKFAGPLNTGLLMILAIWLCRNFLRSTYGRNLIAIGQDPVAAEMAGIRLLPNRMLSLAISAALAGLSGGLLAHYLTFIQPTIFNMDLSGLLTAGVVAGGMGSLTGPIVAVAIFVVVPELFRGLALWRLVLYGVILVVIINYRPKGLFGYEELSLANLPKLFLIAGLTIGLTAGATYFRAYSAVWGVPAGLGAGLLAGLIAAAVVTLAGYGLARGLRPIVPRVRAVWRVLLASGIGALAPLFGRGQIARVPVHSGTHPGAVPVYASVAGAPAPVMAGASGSGAPAMPAAPDRREHNVAAEPLLAVTGLRKRFGGLVAIAELDLSVYPNEVFGLIGPNGSGKTTVFNLVSGVYRPDAGSIRFNGRELAGLRPDSIALGGISRTFQNIRLFPRMSVLQNVQTALHPLTDYSLPAAFVGWPWTVPHGEAYLEESARELLETVGLASYADQPAGLLPYGLQRKLEIARALALQPRLLLLDEPAAGMNPEESLELVDLLREIQARRRLAIVLIEHHMDVVMNLCSRIAVLNFGRKIAEGTPEEIQANPEVLRAYLGEKTEHAAIR